MKLALVLLSIVVLALAGCPKPTPSPNAPDASDAQAPNLQPDAALTDSGFPLVDSGPADLEDPTETAAQFPACVAACRALRTLGCPEAAKPDGGKTCYRICADGETNGLSLKPACVASKADVAGVRSCGTVRCRK